MARSFAMPMPNLPVAHSRQLQNGTAGPAEGEAAVSSGTAGRKELVNHYLTKDDGRLKPWGVTATLTGKKQIAAWRKQQGISEPEGILRQRLAQRYLARTIETSSS